MPGEPALRPGVLTAGPDGLLDGDGVLPTLDLVAAEAKDVHAAGDIAQEALPPQLVVVEEAGAEADLIQAGLGPVIRLVPDARTARSV